MYGRLCTRAMGVISEEDIGDGSIEVVHSVSCAADSDKVVVIVAVCFCTCSFMTTQGLLRRRAVSLRAISGSGHPGR